MIKKMVNGIYYYVDQHNNKWNSDNFTKEIAELYSAQLIDCFNCEDSRQLINCNNCFASFKLINCNNCNCCNNCIDCFKCLNCDNLINAENVEM